RKVTTGYQLSAGDTSGPRGSANQSGRCQSESSRKKTIGSLAYCRKTVRIGPQGTSRQCAVPNWLRKRIAVPLPKRGSQAGEAGWRLAVAQLQIGLEKGGPAQSAPWKGSPSTS